MAPIDVTPSAGDSLQPLEVDAESRAELPRFSIIHLMAWTAATAVAFVPLSWWNAVRDETSVVRTSATLAMSVMGLASGTYLFVIACMLVWRRRGLRARFEPGHWLALKGAVGWAESVMMISVIYASGAAGISVIWFVQALRLLVGLVFFSLFMWLALRAQEPSRWRWTFATFAVAPVVREIMGMALMLVGSARTPLIPMASYAVAQAVQALVLANALIGDGVHGTRRHWSHWMGSVVYLVALAASTLIYAAYALFPQLTSVR